jgi:hypothetical protein
MDRDDSGMREDMVVEVKVVEREYKVVVLARHWTGDGAKMHRRARLELKEREKSRCSGGQPTFTSRDSNYST